MRLLGIAGGSGSGKTTLARAVAAALGERVVLRLTQDDYYHDLSHLPLAERAVRNFDEPAALDLPLLGGHLQHLREGHSIEKPIYDMSTHTRAGSVEIAPRPFAIVEGTLVAALGDVFDLLVYVDLPETDRLARRLKRDCSERGRDEPGVRRQWRDTVLPMHRRHTAPARARADLVVDGDATPGPTARRIAALLG